MKNHLITLHPAWLPREFARIFIVLGVGTALLQIVLFATSFRYGWGWMPWNMFLAWLPLVFACGVLRGADSPKRVRRVLGWICWPLWLLFYPNAPYLLTSLLHLNDVNFVASRNNQWVFLFTTDPAAWFSLLLMIAGVGMGVLFGFVSLAMLQRQVARRLGTLWSWLLVLVTSLLSGWAIWMGRGALRLNSWDLFTRPLHTLGEIFSAMDGNALRLSLIFAAMCLGGYVLVWALLPKEKEE
ncbi:MAG: DUF1361 domain-containing protein [Oscillospiraceae bacterium]|nr:DUF1361 domain-containing protein [Oscillospiraceae bacterium]